MSYTREHGDDIIPLLPVHKTGFSKWCKDLPDRHRHWVESNGFSAEPGSWIGLADANGKLEACAFGLANEGWLYQLAALPGSLPSGRYRLVATWSLDHRIQASIGWGLATYRFSRYRKAEKQAPVLCLEPDIAEVVECMCAAQYLVRDLVNTPAEDMGPAELADAATGEVQCFDAKVDIVKGEDLLSENFPAIHAVGRAAAQEPRFIRATWGKPGAPLVALVGKGVCFDTGGLDLKNAAGMLIMKKDMGGAAHVIALASLIMHYKLPVRLMLLIPAVENSVAGNAYRPGDVINTRKGLTIEIGNTDAEGRVVLADGLAYACEHKPDLVIDFATLTGAARVALGADLPPVFSNRLEIANAIMSAGERVEDPVWVMPLYQPYKTLLKSDIADLNNTGSSSYGGCITAALFLEHFIEPEIPWVHIDTFAWNQSARPGRPAGGEALGLRAVFNYLRERFT